MISICIYIWLFLVPSLTRDQLHHIAHLAFGPWIHAQAEEEVEEDVHAEEGADRPRVLQEGTLVGRHDRHEQQQHNHSFIVTSHCCIYP